MYYVGIQKDVYKNVYSCFINSQNQEVSSMSMQSWTEQTLHATTGVNFTNIILSKRSYSIWLKKLKWAKLMYAVRSQDGRLMIEREEGGFGYDGHILVFELEVGYNLR